MKKRAPIRLAVDRLGPLLCTPANGVRRGIRGKHEIHLWHKMKFFFSGFHSVGDIIISTYGFPVSLSRQQIRRVGLLDSHPLRQTCLRYGEWPSGTSTRFDHQDMNR